MNIIKIGWKTVQRVITKKNIGRNSSQLVVFEIFSTSQGVETKGQDIYIYRFLDQFYVIIKFDGDA